MYLFICAIFVTIQLHVQCHFTVIPAWISLMTKESNIPSCIYLLMPSVHWILLPILWTSFFLPFDLYKFSMLSRISLMAWMVKNLKSGRPGFDPWVGKILWKREWLPSAVFLPRESHRQRSQVGCSPLDPKESDTAERLTQLCGSLLF